MKRLTILAVALIAMVVCVAALAFTGILPVGKALAALYTAVPALGFAALTADRDTHKKDGLSLNLGVAAAKKIYKGSLVARDANGNATPGAVATTLLGVGRAEETVDNSSGGAGDESVTIRKGIFKFGNSAAADEITNAEIGASCYIVDDQTVAKTDGTGTRSVAGTVYDVDSDGVWVKFE